MLQMIIHKKNCNFIKVEGLCVEKTGGRCTGSTEIESSLLFAKTEDPIEAEAGLPSPCVRSTYLGADLGGQTSLPLSDVQLGIVIKS